MAMNGTMRASRSRPAALVEADREEAHDGRLRRYYRLTRDGRSALAEEAELRAATARVVRARLDLTGPAAAGATG
jgi:PadR family transcriptional regulator, regulatory protein PadR